MAKTRASYTCTECGYVAPKWLGRCPECHAWGTIDASSPGLAASPSMGLKPGPTSGPARPIVDESAETAHARPTGIDELDRVLGGGMVPGAVMLLAGEPGVGKSTLLLEVAHRWATQSNSPALIVTGEESASQVRLRAARTGADSPQLYLAAETDLAALATHVDDVKPSLLIVDSVQTISHGQADGSTGGVTQVRAVAASLIALAKERNMSCVIVGHVTKDGGIAGPRVLEHLVDVVLHFEGDRHSTLRIVRAVKNRYGPADEMGCFEMFDGGIRGLADPSGLFLSRKEDATPGTCVTVSVEGRRPLLAEVQALVAPSPLATPRRAVSGLDPSRVAMILAVTERRGRIRLADRDVYVATVGGARLREPATDLACALAIASAVDDKPLHSGFIAIGEVGLAGDVRRVTGTGRRLAEAARLGFTEAFVPAGWAGDGEKTPRGIAIREIATLADAFRARS